MVDGDLNTRWFSGSVSGRDSTWIEVDMIPDSDDDWRFHDVVYVELVVKKNWITRARVYAING